MVSIAIRNLDDGVKTRLGVRAAEQGRSMEDEARAILREALDRGAVPAAVLGTALHDLFRPFGRAALDIPLRQPMRMPPSFD